MSLPLNYTDPAGQEWILDEFTPRTIYETVKLSDDTAIIQKRSEWTIIIWRKVINLVSWEDQTGDERSSFSFATGPATGFLYTSTAKKFRCAAHKLKLDEFKTGEYTESQTWVYRSLPEEVEEGEF